MRLPKFHETFIPILTILSNNEIIHYKELDEKVSKKFYIHLPFELLNQKTSSGYNTLFDRIEWGKSYLKQAGIIIYPKRGFVQITEKGRNILRSGSYTFEDLKNDKDFINYHSKDTIDTSNSIEDNSPQDLIDQGIKNIENEVKNELLEKLKSSNPFYFQTIVLELLKKIGYGDMIETSKTRDGGIDGIINKDKLGLEKIYIQAKRYTDNKVREGDIRNFIGAMSADTDKGIFVTTSIFDEGAIKKSNNAHHKIILINGNELVDLMYEYGVGVQIKQTYTVKGIDEDFFI